MKIALDAYPLSREKPTGLASYMHNLLKELRLKDAENEYLLYAFNGFTLPFKDERWKIRLTKESSINRMSTLWLAFGAKRALLRDKADIFVGTQSFIPPDLPRPIKKVLVIHDLCLFTCPRNVPLPLYAPQRFLFPRSIRSADRIIAISGSTRADIKRFFPEIDERAIRTIYYGGPDQEFSPCDKQEARDFIARRFGIHGKFILTASSLEWRKNLTGLLRAYDICRKKYNIQHKLFICGGERRKGASEIIRLYKRLALEGSVYFTGHLEKKELRYLYNAADAMIFPSFYEGFGLPPLEAMACKAPCVVSDIAVLREIMQDACLFCDPHSAADIAEKILRVLNDDALRRELITKGEERAKAFSWKKAASDMLDVFRELSALDNKGIA